MNNIRTGWDYTGVRHVAQSVTLASKVCSSVEIGVAATIEATREVRTKENFILMLSLVIYTKEDKKIARANCVFLFQ